MREGPGPTTRRGDDGFVAVSWDELTELLADELRRVIDAHGNQAIFGGSHGWSSAGRFHHAQSQVHRFLNCGTTGHPARNALQRYRTRGGRIVSVSPLRDDVEGDCEWFAPADDLIRLARRMSENRTIVTVSWSLQRVRQANRRRGWG